MRRNSNKVKSFNDGDPYKYNQTSNYYQQTTASTVTVVHTPMGLFHTHSNEDKNLVGDCCFCTLF